MRIVSIELWNVRVPLRHAYVSSRAIKPFYDKTIIRLGTDAGLVGLGETMGAPAVFALVRVLAETLIGKDAADRSSIFASPGARGSWPRRTIEECNALGGLEMACWDLAGRRYGLPVCELLGGRIRDRIPMVCELSAGPLPLDTTRQEARQYFDDLGNVAPVVEDARAQVDRYGYRTLKLKSTGTNATFDLQVMTALRKALGPDMGLRHDPNGAYSVVEAISLYRRLDPLGLQWYEDPTAGMEGMRRVRRSVKTPLATNMWVVQEEHLAPAIRMGCVDVVGVDPFNWGGLANARDAASICAASGLRAFTHCFFDLGITTAALLHLAAALPALDTGVDTCLYLQDEDVTRERFVVQDGCLSAPPGPGLGMTLDEDALRRWAINQVKIGE